MKIVHICLEAPYIDGWAYQENIIPECHARMGHEVTVIGSRNSLPYYVKKAEDTKSHVSPYYVGDVKVVRTDRKWSFLGKLDYYEDLLKLIESEKPDLLYHHGGQSLSLLMSKDYVKKHKRTKWVVDFHAEYYNTATNALSREILHKLIWRSVIQESLPYISKIYCISPSVKEFCMEMYSIPPERMEYLYLGTIVPEAMIAKRMEIRKEVRSRLGIDDTTFLLITGGKLNNDKRLDIVAAALRILDDDAVHLVVFGLSDPGDEKFAERVFMGVPRVHMVGWCDSDALTKYYLAADLAVFPGGQSVVWQQAIGTGLPAIFRKWPGNEYLNAGNAIFLYSDEGKDLAQWIKVLSKNNTSLLEEMRIKALDLGRHELSYENESIRICDVVIEKNDDEN